jgi:alkylation response protein AidB-like acyl-CoA dehydrogenase
VAQPINRYKADLRDMRFLLFEQFGIEDLLGKEPFAEWGREEVEMVLDEMYKWVTEVTGPLNQVGDKQGCTLADGKVTTPEGFKAAWKSLYEAGWRLLGKPVEHGGQGAPFTVHALADEMQSGANTAFNMYPGLTDGVAEVIAAFGTDEQKKTYLHRLFDGSFGGTMCLTEPQAGSDVGASTTKATPIGDGKYKIEGTKIFISAGDHDLTENIIHLVLARTEDAPAGTKGLSLFIVPRDKLDGGSNDVTTGGLEHKMGINGSATAVLNFGDDGNCVGELLGTEEQVGMKMMFRMMNFARIGVGIQGLAVAASAYQNARDYALERKQGPHISEWKDASAPKVAIIEHPDVRRMLLEMKSKVDGIRALAVKLTMHLDHVHALAGKDDEKAGYHQGQVDLLVPLLKAYGSDQAFQICATAIQVFGGAGYLKDHPVEQYARDAKIFSIYEGTNHIQALDLVGRKLGYRGGVNFQALVKDVSGFIAKYREDEELKDAVAVLASSIEVLGGTAMRFLGWFQKGEMEMVPLAANRFLEMMSETVIGWLLLEAAAIAKAKMADLPEGHGDRDFYAGKIAAAKYFAHNTLPGVAHKGAILGKEDRTALEVPTTAL